MLKIDKVELRGNQLITTSAIPAGTAFYKISDYRLVSEPTYQTIQVEAGVHLEEQYLIYTNHSCDPNIVLDMTALECRALRDIEAGEELSFFYPSTEWTMCQPFTCNCGSTNCIETVKGAKYLSLEVLSKQFINQHIRLQTLQCLEEKVLGHTVPQAAH